MTNKLKLRIADIVFSLIGEGGINRLKDNPYHLFLTEGDPEVILRFKYSSDFQGDKSLPGEILFDTQPNWRLCYCNKKYIVQTRDRTAVLTPDFTSGEIYITKNPRGFPFTYPLDEILMINLLGRKRGILVHACGVKTNNGVGLLFAGTSQMGKSTMANLWKKEKDTTILSDDRIIIRKMEGQFWIYGTPWHGDAGVASPEKTLIKKIFFLNHAQRNKMTRIKGIDAVSRLLVCSFPTFYDKKGMGFTLGFVDEIISNVPCYVLDFLPDKSVIDFVRDR